VARPGGRDQTVVRPQAVLARSNAVLAVTHNAVRPLARNNAAPCPPDLTALLSVRPILWVGNGPGTGHSNETGG
jgi:hypothetical protein